MPFDPPADRENRLTLIVVMIAIAGLIYWRTYGP